MTPGPTNETAPRPARYPTNRLNNTPSAGKTRISVSAGKSTVITSPSKQRQVVRMDSLAVAENRNDYAEADGRFRCRYRHDEKDNHLPVHRAEPVRERDKRQVHRVQHQPDRHEHHEDV